MRIAKVVGTVTLNQNHSQIMGATLKLAIPMTQDELRHTSDFPAADSLVVYDEFSAGMGDLIMLSEGGEAAQPFYPDFKPVDAYNAGIVDSVDF